MIFALLFSFFLFISQTQDLAQIEGEWKGFIEIPPQELEINLTFSYSEQELDGTIDIPRQNAFNIPVEVVKATADSLIFQFETGTGAAVFYGLRNNPSKIGGRFEQHGESFLFSLTKNIHTPGMHDELPSQTVMIPTPGGTTEGSLVLTHPPSPLVVLLSGSGFQDRDENIAGFRVFREISYHLYQAGYSTFRYDDRGVGSSAGEQDATIGELAEDLKSILAYLTEHYSEKFTEIILLGHSQGGLVAATAAQESDVSGIIFVAAPFLRGDKIINGQIRKISETQGISNEVVEENLNFQTLVYEAARTGSGWKEIEKMLAERLHKQLQQLPEPQREALGNADFFIRNQIERQLAGAKTRWFKSFIEFEPAGYITTLEIPMLAVFGEKDVQVLPGPNLEAAERVKHTGSALQTATIPEANHLFQKANTGLPGEYGLLEKSFAAGFMEAITQWLNELEKSAVQRH